MTWQTNTRQAPTNFEPEQSVLGAILLRPKVMDQVSDLLKPEDFYRPAHRLIYQAMLDLRVRAEPLDLVTVTTLLMERGQLEEVGGPIFLAKLSENVGTTAHVEHYAKLVLKEATKRNLEMLGRCLAFEVDKGGEVEDLLTLAESQLVDVTTRYRSSNGIKQLSSGIVDISEFTQLSFPPKQVYLYPWLQESQIIMICGDRGLGKTQVGVSLCISVASGESFGPWKAGAPAPCLYLDGEMSPQDLQVRFKQFLNGSLQERLHIYCDAYLNQLGLPRANLLNPEWRVRMKEILLAKGVKLWVVDNIASLCPGMDQNKQLEWSPINDFFLELRFAGITTIFLHHTNRSGGQRGTGAREDNLDISIMLEQPANYSVEDGSRFIWRFTKKRIPQDALHLMEDTEFCLERTPDGAYSWSCRSAKQVNKVAVLKLLDEGLKTKDIAKELKITEGRVSQIKKEAKQKGLITSDGKLTQAGRDRLNL